MCYIADICCENKSNNSMYGVDIISDGHTQSVNVYYEGGSICLSENHLYHVASEDETDICIFRNRRVINPDYCKEQDERRCEAEIKRNDVVLLITKNKETKIYIRYLTELFYVNNKRRRLSKDYKSFANIFNMICSGRIFAMIYCFSIK